MTRPGPTERGDDLVIADNILNDVPYESPVQPVQLHRDNHFRFDCHPSLACFNACCKSIDITLTPYDILRLKRRLGLSSKELVGRYTVPFEMDTHGMPGLKMAAKPGTSECVFLGENGCAVYDDRPVACRYYALGAMGVRKKDSATVEETYFVVKEAHCLGHDEVKRQTVAEYRKEQGIEIYDERNRAWRDVVLKKRSGGPAVGSPSPRSLQLFDMCSYDLDSFREFVQSDGFREIFDVDDDEMATLLADEDALLEFAMRFLKQVLFGEKTISVKAHARRRRMEKRKRLWRQRHEEELARRRESHEAQKCD